MTQTNPPATFLDWIKIYFSEDLSINPEKYLGPNYKTVLNFYSLYWNGTLKLNKGFIDVADMNFEYKTLIRNLASEIVPQDIIGTLPWPLPVWELISMHLILERGETLKFIPFFTSNNDCNEL